MKKFIVSFFTACCVFISSNKVVFALANSSVAKGHISMMHNAIENSTKMYHTLGGTSFVLFVVFGLGFVGWLSIGILCFPNPPEDKERNGQ